MDPVTIIGGATVAFNALKKGFQFGKDLQEMGGQLNQWASSMSDLAYLEQKNKNPRRLTPLEALRLMGFDQIEGRYKNTDEIFVVSDSQAFRQLGNAVVPHVVEAVGREVLRTIENN